MANLDKYERDAAEGDLGQKAWDKGKAEAKRQAKKPVKKLANKAKDKLMEKTGAAAIKKAAGRGMKAALKAMAHAARTAVTSALTFLVSNPVGWIISAVLIIGGIAICAKMEHDRNEAVEAEITADLVEEDGLTEDGVAILMGDCPEAKSSSALADVNVDAVVEQNARMIYAVFKKYGLNNECIAGMLGNLFVECHLDTTAVEGIYDEPYQLGPRKTTALSDLDAHVTGYIWPAYESKGMHIRKNGYMGPDGKNYCGLGFPQWTGPAAYSLLEYAKSTGRDWWACDFQTAYLLSDAHYRPGFFAQWKENMQTDVIEAERYFAAGYEGTTHLAVEERQEAAQMWYEKMEGWEVDEAYANSIFKLSEAMGAAAGDNAIGESASACAGAGEIGPYDNSSIASAAASYAYATKNEGKGNNGTPLYIQVHDNIFPGDTIYQSCDRSIACAIRWSGSDDEFPSGDSTGQYNYLKASPKWESVGMASALSMDKLMPGDVFATNGHVLLYVGHEAVVAAHGENAPADADSVSGSFGDRSPGCGNDATRIIGRGGVDGKGRAYEVFRCTDPDNSETYKNAGASAVME